MIKEQAINEKLDNEWMQLILEALAMGINKEEIREFLTKTNR